MIEIPFSIPVTGIIRLNGNTVTVTVNEARTAVNLPDDYMALLPRKKPEPGVTLSDMVLEAARELTIKQNVFEFTASDLYRTAVEKHPWINQRSFLSRVIACTPNHGSYNHYRSHCRYLRLLQKGYYMLMLEQQVSNEPEPKNNQTDDSNSKPTSKPKFDQNLFGDRR